MLPRLIQSLDMGAREIDVTFARAGEQLGQGLNLFEGLERRLTNLSDQLGGSEIDKAGATLAGMACELREIGGGLAREISALNSLATDSHTASQALDGLLDHMRLITILARSARIEAVSIDVSNGDLGDFTSEIAKLTSQAQSTIEDCAREHDHLIAILSSALTAQQEFEQRYGGALETLAANLEATLAEVAGRQRRGRVLTGDAAVHSGKIALAAGGAIISLQSGDSIRQRLEHAVAALQLLADVEAGTGAASELDEAERHATAVVLCRIEAAQLDASAASLRHEAGAIEEALGLLTGDTTYLIELVRSLYGDEDGVSFMAALEADLAQAAELLGKCNRARAGVDGVTRRLTDLLETCRQTVRVLMQTVSSIVLIGINAGLRAARVGTGGRSLVVVAQELKVAADHVAGDAALLAPVFIRMGEAATGLTRLVSHDAAYFSALDRSMRDALAAMRQTSDRLNDTLAQLTHEGRGFSDVLAHAQLSFSNVASISDQIAGAAVEVGDIVAGAAHVLEIGTGIDDFLRTQVRRRYTMADERQIHDHIVSEHVVSSRKPIVAS